MTINIPLADLIAILPELIVIGAACLVLALDPITPPSRIDRFRAVRARLWMVSPTRSGARTCHSKPMKASTASGGFGTRHPSPVVKQSGRRSGTSAASSGGSRVMPW